MSEYLGQKKNAGLMVCIKMLAIVAMVSSVVMLVHIMQATYAPSRLWVLNVLLSDPIILFVAYLLIGYNKNYTKLLAAYFVVGAAAATLGSIVLAIQYMQVTMHNLYSVSLWNSYDTYYIVQVNQASLLMNIYIFFAIDAFLKFRLVKASRVLSVVSAVSTCIADAVIWMGDGYAYDYPDVYWVIRMLMPICLILFYFGAVEDYRPAPKPVVPVPMPVPTPARFCGYCGASLQGGPCPRCGAQN